MLYFLKKNRIIKQKYNIQTRLYLNSPIKNKKLKIRGEKPQKLSFIISDSQ